MDRDRALEIVASYGADALRWPLSERQALQELSRSDAVVQAALAQSEPLDAALRTWAVQSVASRSADAAALAAMAAVPVRRRWWTGAVAGGAIAASVALAVAVLPPQHILVPAPVGQINPDPMTVAPVQTLPAIQQVAAVSAQPKSNATVGDADADDLVFTMMFTETPEEEMYL